MAKIFRRFIFTPILLLFIWIAVTLYLTLNSDISFTVLSKLHKLNIFKPSTTEDMLSSKVISGEFNAFENNLGMIAIRFNTHNRSAKNIITFRIKEKGNNNWYFETRINTDQIVDQEIFPFGFPIITNSKNRLYQFQIMILQKGKNNSIALSRNQPVFISRYQFDKNILKKNPLSLAYFSLRKSQAALEDKNRFYLSLSFLTPLIVYILWQILLKRFIGQRLFKITNPDLVPFNNLSVIIFLIFLGVNILFIKSLVYPIDLIFSFLWLFIMRFYKITPRFSLLIASIFFLISVILTQINISGYVDKIAFFGGVFLLLGSFQLWQNYLN